MYIGPVVKMFIFNRVMLINQYGVLFVNLTNTVGLECKIIV